jgi:hypothetical protein
MTTHTGTVPARSDGGGGAHIVDNDVFGLLVDMEIRKAQRLRYWVSLICVDVEPETAVSDAVPSGAAARMVAPVIRSTDAVVARDPSTVALLLIDAEASNLPTILQRLKAAGLETVPWSAGGACYPQTATSAQELFDQALQMMAQAKHDGGRRFYVRPSTS